MGNRSKSEFINQSLTITTKISPFINLNLMIMKNLMMKISTMLALVAIFAMSFGVSSCKKDDETTPPPVIVLDGIYVTGTASAHSDLNSANMMKITYNENGQKIDSTLFELYTPLKAGSNNFSIVQVAGSVQTTFGAAAGFGVVATPTTDEPKVPFQRGPVSSTSKAKFTVPEDGFYHVVFDTKYNVVAIMRVHWGMIGAATPHGWTSDTMMTESAFNATSMSWTLTGLTLNKGSWKFRYSHGWKVEIDTTLVDPTMDVKVNTNFGGSITALKPGGSDMPNDVPGIYTVTLAYTLGSGYTATLTKTADIPPIDYSAYQMGIIGNAYLLPSGLPANWDENFGTSLPVITGVTTYTWTYTLDLIADKDFKFRQGTDWSGKSIGFTEVTMAGGAAANFVDDGGNFKVTTAGNYTLVLQINAVTETYTLTATKN